MPIIYKTDILAALKEAGYNTNRIRKEKERCFIWFCLLA